MDENLQVINLILICSLSSQDLVTKLSKGEGGVDHVTNYCKRPISDNSHFLAALAHSFTSNQLSTQP